MSKSRAAREFEEYTPSRLRQEAQRALHIARAEAASGGRRDAWRGTAEFLARAVLSLTDAPRNSDRIAQ